MLLLKFLAAPCCARKKPRERRQLCRVPQMASSVPSVLIQRHHQQQQTRDSKPETLPGSSRSISSLTTMLLLYITVSACTTSSSPPRKRKTSLTERITSSLQTRWASIIFYSGHVAVKLATDKSKTGFLSNMIWSCSDTALEPFPELCETAS